jgi:O-antigen ligase
MTTKRSIFIGVLSSAFFLFYRYRMKVNLKKILFTFVIIILVSTILLGEFYAYYLKYLYFRFNELWELNTGTGGRRLREWKDAITIFMQAPIFGDIYNLYFNYRVSLLKEMHNTFLEKICMQGIMGATLWVGVICSGLKRRHGSKILKEFESFKNIIIAMLLFSIPVIAFNTSWVSIYPFGYLGILFSLNNKKSFLELQSKNI